MSQVSSMAILEILSEHTATVQLFGADLNIGDGLTCPETGSMGFTSQF
ncbi:hypothetical protein TIFTF001_018325 [Ficus carica]|uniref:Uncharacterized protein n=1 Tax=Ficus carica TaxID=3494 RepID=A0AA88ADU3_FICCA|nr:hypothetical protein TIFTF001_018325 [Ficus carica]